MPLVPDCLRNLGVLFVLMSGCATEQFQDSFSKIDEKKPSSQKPSWMVDANGNSDSDAEWTKEGQQMRPGPAKQENDVLRDLFVSPRAQQIENSLGIN